MYFNFRATWKGLPPAPDMFPKGCAALLAAAGLKPKPVPAAEGLPAGLGGLPVAPTGEPPGRTGVGGRSGLAAGGLPRPDPAAGETASSLAAPPPVGGDPPGAEAPPPGDTAPPGDALPPPPGD